MRNRPQLVAVAVGALLLAASCSNSSGTTGATGDGAAKGPATTASAADLAKNLPSDQPGVTDTEIRVASLGSVSNSFGVDLSQAPKGAQAYFDMVNANGGIYGRKLVLAKQYDDQGLKNKETVTGLVSDNTSFAVVAVSSPLFTGAPELADAGIPTFGWVNSTDWAGPPNFFGNRASANCITCGTPQVPYAARDAGAKKIGIIAYGFDQSKVCADGVKNAFNEFPVAEVAFVDDTVPLGATDYTVQVQKMKDQNIDVVVTCTDTNSVINLSREMKKQQATTKLFLQAGYESDLLANFSDVLEGSYVFTSVSPVETEPAPPGLADYKKWIANVPGAKVGEQSIIGWVNAELLYQGLVAAGPEFTQLSVVDALNQITDWRAGGVVPPVNWTVAHDQFPDPLCQATVRVQGGKFVPVFGDPGKPFTCLSFNGDLPAKAPTVG
jgi:ABC-type branched-subunit amino acid transport system substrate-binding protein